MKEIKKELKALENTEGKRTPWTTLASKKTSTTRFRGIATFVDGVIIKDNRQEAENKFKSIINSEEFNEIINKYNATYEVERKEGNVKGYISDGKHIYGVSIDLLIRIHF